jgi:hypothetical protein
MKKVIITIASANLAESRGQRGRTTYKPNIQYTYEVAGNTYTGDRLDMGDRATSSMEDVLSTMARYRSPQSVTVHYNPKDPAVALLEPGTTTGNWLCLGAGLILTAFGTFSARSLWQTLQSNDFAPSSGF